jgi:hypothetical protein
MSALRRRDHNDPDRAEAKRAERERKAAASRAATDEGGEA